MSTFRDTSVPVTCAECGNRVSVPLGRPGLRLKCPKCGSVLTAPATTGGKPSATEPAPVGPTPLGTTSSAAMKPSTDIAAEIDALLLSDLSNSSPPQDSSPTEARSHAIPPTEIPRAETPHSGVVAFDAPPETDGYKLSDELGPLPLPPPLPQAAFAPPPHAHNTARGEHEFRLSLQLDLPEAAGSRMQHVIEAEAVDEGGAKHDGGGEKPVAKPEKFTPDATLSDPRRAFLRGVFEFPFYFEVLPQWIKLAFTLTLELILAWWIVALTLSSAGGGFGGGGIAVGSLLMLLPAVLLACLWVAMTWAVGSAILEDTAAGMTHIENWPESLVLDDLPSLVFPAIALFMAALPGVAINWLSEHGARQIWFLAPVTTLLLFPFTLLSILETGSVFIPFSKPIFRCVYNRPGTWAWFYAESTAIVAVAAWGSTELWLQSEGSIVRFSFAAILATAGILIYFRLLGRLALVCANQAYDWTENDVEETEKETEKKDELQQSSPM